MESSIMLFVKIKGRQPCYKFVTHVTSILYMVNSIYIVMVIVLCIKYDKMSKEFCKLFSSSTQ